jgi:hypothetical protein
VSFTFVTAARITLTRKGFDAETQATPRDLLTARITADPEALTVLRHRDGALEAYLWTVGHSGAWETPAQRLLLMLAGAAAFKDDDAEDHILFWEDAAGTLPTRNEDALLALLAVGRRHARFVGGRPLADLLTVLEPAEEAFAELAESMEDCDGPQGPSAYVDPAVVLEFPGGQSQSRWISSCITRMIGPSMPAGRPPTPTCSRTSAVAAAVQGPPA